MGSIDEGYGLFSWVLHGIIRDWSVAELNALMKDSYSDDFFVQLLGKDQLWNGYKSLYIYIACCCSIIFVEWNKIMGILWCYGEGGERSLLMLIFFFLSYITSSLLWFLLLRMKFATSSKLKRSCQKKEDLMCCPPEGFLIFFDNYQENIKKTIN